MPTDALNAAKQQKGFNCPQSYLYLLSAPSIDSQKRPLAMLTPFHTSAGNMNSNVMCMMALGHFLHQSEPLN